MTPPRELGQRIRRELGLPPEASERLRRVAALLSAELPAEACAVYLAEGGGQLLTLEAFAGTEGLGVGAVARQMDELVMGGGPVLIGGWMAVPIRDGDACRGALELRARAGADFSAEQVEGVVLAAREIARFLAGRPEVPAEEPEAAAIAEELRQRYSELSVLYEVGKALTSTLEVAQLLELVTRLAATVIMSRGSVLRLVEEGAGDLPVVAAFGVTERETRTVRIGEGVAGAVARDGVPVLLPPDPGHASGERAAAALRPSLICAPLIVRDRVIGTLTLLDKLARHPGGSARFTSSDLQLLSTLASQAAIAIENARLFQGSRQQADRLRVLSELGRALSASLDLQEVFDVIVRSAVSLLDPALAQLWVYQGEAGALEMRASAGQPDLLAVPRTSFRPGEGVVGTVFQTREVEHLAAEDPRYLLRDWAREKGVTAVVGVPLLLGERALGVLCVGRRAAPAFSGEEIDLLRSFAHQAAVAIENARLFQEAERLGRDNLVRLREISILNEIGTAMQGTVHLERVLRIILTGVTFGGGFGFNRALLFLTDEAGTALEGRMGVGPATGEEAARVWGELSRTPKTLREVLWERAEQDAQAEALDSLARSLRIPLEPGGGILALTALERRPLNVADAARDPRVNQAAEGRLGAPSFATVPLLAKDRVVGVLMVDNRFNGRPITDEDLEFLSVFASQAALAIESAQVYRRLEDTNRELQATHLQLVRQEKLAALGEMAAHVVHEIRNPLVSIGGFARRLIRRLQPDQAEGRYAQIIAREVDRLERIVQDVLALSRGPKAAPAETDLNEILDDCVVLFEEKFVQQGVRIQRETAPDLPKVQADVAQIKQAVLNLLYNALEAMPEGGELHLRTAARDGAVWIEVADTGGGIPQEILDSIFSPFFTTKELGTGLGLTLVDQILRGHGGRVEVENQPGRGATFRLCLPVAGPT